MTRALRHGPRLKGTIHFEDQFPVEVMIDTSDVGCPFLELAHATRDDRKPDRMVRDLIDLTWTTPTYGGRRWWFVCPRTRRTAAKLYLPLGGWHWCACDPDRLCVEDEIADAFQRDFSG